jgi:hypothetical protein
MTGERMRERVMTKLAKIKEDSRGKTDKKEEKMGTEELRKTTELHEQ